MNPHDHCERCGAPTTPLPSASRAFCAECASLASTGARSSSELLFTLAPAEPTERTTAEDLRALATASDDHARVSFAPFPSLAVAPRLTPRPRAALTLFALATFLFAGSAAALTWRVTREDRAPHVELTPRPSEPLPNAQPPREAPEPEAIMPEAIVPEATAPEATAPEASAPEAIAPTPTVEPQPHPERRVAARRPRTPEPALEDAPTLPPLMPSAPAANTRVPTRRDVRLAFRGLESAVAMCAEGAGGMVVTRVTFTGESGRVAHAEVTDSTLPPAARSCIARALRDLALPRFAQDRFTVAYPFRL